MGYYKNFAIFLNEKRFKILYFAFIYSYLNYGNITWENKSDFITASQKHTARMYNLYVYCEEVFVRIIEVLTDFMKSVITLKRTCNPSQKY